ncbi:peptidase M20 [Reticulibacter mediterranei]|uniref:Peptidase M20 n=1 Tax=Reticulibacter mediterranei TaxID=2778369 RepID=A0A8J3IE19_9CHLR|nr:M20/M25/M40 family metallo-hydrolase [Reticulibacter mediterranei]GHO90823.1 peptidase M20 [Reticulibacter mediterranei]
MSLTSYELDHLRSLAATQADVVVELTQRICAVPAPTGDEWQRGELVAELLRERGYTPEADEVGNVYVRRGQKSDKPVLMVLAHLDTVFPHTTPLKIVRDGDILRGPGIGDNSLSVAAMLGILDILDQLGQQTVVDLVAVANVGEEGLGNLRGARAAVERYRDQLGAVIAIDGNLGHITHAAVGSQRWRITVRGPGGHSYGAFGRPSAIHGLARIIAAIADLPVPQSPKTTYNVGVIEGGTSVNTIAAQATALLDLRSTDVVALAQLAEQVRAIVKQCAGAGLQAEIEVLGERPAGSRSQSDPLVQLAARTLTWLGIEPEYGASSTDANIPISLNIPAICVGVTQVRQVHTLEEWLSIPPIGDGLAQLVWLCIEAGTLIAAQ